MYVLDMREVHLCLDVFIDAYVIEFSHGFYVLVHSVPIDTSCLSLMGQYDRNSVQLSYLIKVFSFGWKASHHNTTKFPVQICKNFFWNRWHRLHQNLYMSSAILATLGGALKRCYSDYLAHFCFSCESRENYGWVATALSFISRNLGFMRILG